MSTCDHHYWSLNDHRFPFVTFLWPKLEGQNLAVVNWHFWHFFWNGRRRLWPKYVYCGVLVTSNLPRPRRHPAWQADVAQDSARSNSIFYMGLAQQFGLFNVFFPVLLLATWVWPNNSTLLISLCGPFNNIFSFWSCIFLGLSCFSLKNNCPI